MSATLPPFDPYALLSALERQGVSYVVVGGFARIVHGTEEQTEGLDLTPSLKPANLRRLAVALDQLDARLASGRRPALDEDLRAHGLLELRTAAGLVKVVAEPAGTRGGYDDLRRAATREPIGKGLRPRVASTGDLARMLAARGRDQDKPLLQQLRHLRELERDLGRGLGL